MEELTTNKKLLGFVIETKEGKYAEVPSYTLEYVRITETTEPIYEDEVYNYSCSYNG